jgi:hypothetical protein
MNMNENLLLEIILVTNKALPFHINKLYSIDTQTKFFHSGKQKHSQFY